MPDGMTPETSSINAFRSLGQPHEMPGANIGAEKAKLIKEEYSQWKDLLGDEEEEDRNVKDIEAHYGQEREEEFAKRDRVLSRLMKAEKPEDVAAALEMVNDYEGVHFGETIDRYTYSAYKKAALEGQRAFEKGSRDIKDLASEGIIEGTIDTSGYLSKNGKIRASGYAIRVDRKITEKTRIVPEVVYDVDPISGERSNPRTTEKTETLPQVDEKIYFGSAKERHALARAHEELHKILVTSEILQNQTILFDETRAGLEAMVKYFYQKQLYFTNLQNQWFFTAADISKMDANAPESLNNQELGEKRDKAMRLYYLVGVSETKEKMEEHLNSTFNLEEILGLGDEKDGTIRKVLRLAGENTEGLNDDQKFEKAVQFLIGKGTKVEWRDAPDGTKVRYYTLDGWLTKDERDPLSKITKKRKDRKADFKKGGGAVGDEFEDGARGYLTEVGNPYAEGSRDNLYMLMARMTEIVGDDMAVTEAGRYFWTRGLRDELGLEVYTDQKNLPTGEQLLDKFNTSTFEKWQSYCESIQKCYTITGEPAGSDLAKIFWPKFWRLKEMMLDRSAGPYLTYDKFNRLTQSLLGLGKIKVVVDGVEENRSIREAWLGYKSDGVNSNEDAKDLGKIDWEQAKMPEEVQERLTGGGAEVGKSLAENEKNAPKIDLKAVTDNLEGYFWVMNYLAGDDNQAKRPWQFIMKGPERFGDLQRSSAYTDMIKFWKIVWHDNMFAWGNWRKEYQAAKKDPKNDKLSRTEVVNKAEGDLKTRAKTWLEYGKKAWYTGLRSMPDYPRVASETVDYVDESGNSKTIRVVEIIEKLAIRYGFLDAARERDALKAMRRQRV